MISVFVPSNIPQFLQVLYYCYVFHVASTVQEVNQENALCILNVVTKFLADC